MTHRTRDVFEFTSSPAGLRVDREQGVIYGVKVLGRKSGNGPIYPQPVTRRALPLYEGAKVNLDHPPRTRPTDDRSVQDRFGKLQNVRDLADGLYADLHYIRSHPLAAVVAEAAESMPDVFGLSHNANIRESLDTGEVVAINRVRSVDLVADPGTTRGIFESQEKRMDPTDMNADPPADDAASNPPQSAEELQNALQDGITQILAGPEDAASKATAIAALAQKLLGVAGDEPSNNACEDDDNNKDDASDQEESLQSPNDVAARLKQLESRERAREILESAGIVPHAQPAVNQARVAALVAVLDDPSQCDALLSTWKMAAVSTPAVKPRSTAANVLESRNANSSASFTPRTVEQMKREAATAFGR